MLTYEPSPGEHVSSAAEAMCLMAKEHRQDVVARFNDMDLKATPDCSPGNIVGKFDAECERSRIKYEASPAGEAVAMSRARSRSLAETAAAEGVLPFGIKDAEAWQSWLDANTDPYGSAVMRYAARWANIMESEMAKGLSLKSVAEPASHRADVEGVTGFMVGCARSMLIRVWEHGEHLKAWHEDARGLPAWPGSVERESQNH